MHSYANAKFVYDFGSSENEAIVFLQESEWWWAKKKANKDDEIEGYVPRNLLGLRPRVQDCVMTSSE